MLKCCIEPILFCVCKVWSKNLLDQWFKFTVTSSHFDFIGVEILCLSFLQGGYNNNNKTKYLIFQQLLKK